MEELEKFKAQAEIEEQNKEIAKVLFIAIDVGSVARPKTNFSYLN